MQLYFLLLETELRFYITMDSVQEENWSGCQRSTFLFPYKLRGKQLLFVTGFLLMHFYLESKFRFIMILQKIT